MSKENDTRPKKWFKKDLRFLTGQVDQFVLFHTPYVSGDKSQVFRDAIERNRLQIILDGARSVAGMLREREQQDEKTAGHFEANPIIYGDSTPEMVLRFRRLAQEARKDAARIEHIIRRLETEGLPPELADYLPERLMPRVR